MSKSRSRKKKQPNNRCLDDGGRHHGRRRIPCHQPSGPYLGRRDIAHVPWDLVRSAAVRAGIERLAPHDLLRTQP
jgi:hypothetical protein